MAEKSEKKFPKGIFPKVVSTTHGTITKLNINKQQFIEYLQSLPNDEKYLKLDILKRPNPTEDSTHYIVVDDWKPTPKETVAPKSDDAKKQEDDIFNFTN
jgi:hypothetical protein